MKKRTDRLSAVALAISDPTRRALLRVTTQRERRVHELARLHPALTLAAISKHLGVLVEAGLVVKRRVGRDVLCSAQLRPLRQLERFLAGYSRFWKLRVDELEQHLRANARKQGDVAK